MPNDEIANMFKMILAKLDEHSTMLKVLPEIQKQTAKIPQMEADILGLKNEMHLMRTVLAETNRAVRRHSQFIDHVHDAPWPRPNKTLASR